MRDEVGDNTEGDTRHDSRTDEETGGAAFSEGMALDRAEDEAGVPCRKQAPVCRCRQNTTPHSLAGRPVLRSMAPMESSE